MAIIVFQHEERSRPGRLGLTLRDHAFKLDIRRLDKGDPVPPDLDNIDAVISLGAKANLDDGHAWIEKEADYIRKAHERSLPVIGVCFGAQMIAHALGGEVAPMQRPEIGFTDVDLLPPAHTDTILTGIAWKTPQFQTHTQKITALPEGAVHLASSAHCAHQAFKVGMRTYAFQYHFEADRKMIDTYIRDEQTALHHAGLTTAEFNTDAEHKYETFARLADRLCINLATYLIPKVATRIRA
jgi:GMP synthase-like glutamine amidotransferase